MKRILLLLTVVIVSITTANAQKSRPPFKPGHDIRFGVGAYPVQSDIDKHYGCYDYSQPNFDSNDYLSYQGAKYFTGVYNLGYAYQFRKWLAVGANLSYSGESQTILDIINDDKIGKEKKNYFNIAPTVRFSWFNREYIQMYSQISLGVAIKTMSSVKNSVKISESDVNISCQSTFFGISVGKRIFGFFEAGVGTQGALILGVGYRFNKK